MQHRSKPLYNPCLQRVVVVGFRNLLASAERFKNGWMDSRERVQCLENCGVFGLDSCPHHPARSVLATCICQHHHSRVALSFSPPPASVAVHLSLPTVERMEARQHGQVVC
jgi:hypothetical protein